MQRFILVTLGITFLVFLGLQQTFREIQPSEGFSTSSLESSELLSPILKDPKELLQKELGQQSKDPTNQTSNEPSKPSILYFLHLQKTGGTTIKDLIHKNLKKVKDVWPGWLDYKKLSKIHTERLSKTFKDKSAIIGHYLYGIHEMVPEVQPRYLTILRNPFDRLVSLFFWHKKQDESENDIGAAHLGSIRSFLRSDRRRFLIDNYLVRVICGPPAFFLPEGKIGKSALGCAKKNLASFELVMILEEYNISLLLAQEKLGFSNLHTSPSKVLGSVRDAESSPMDAEERKSIEGFIKWDRQLYNFAKTLFCQQLLTFQIPQDNIFCNTTH